ncbi:MAG TPA: chorismate mutase [Mycobacterium sp.]|nr:chorismate mutase [Mycobacterium sp.]
MTEEPEPNVETCDIGSAMEQRRERLDELDTMLVEVIAERMQLCKEIARIKRKGQIPMMQPHRLDHVRAKSIEEGRKLSLDEGFVHRLIDVVVHESCRLEDLIIDNESMSEDRLHSSYAP